MARLDLNAQSPDSSWVSTQLAKTTFVTPPHIVSNQDLVVDLKKFSDGISPKWIRERTGIANRRMVSPADADSDVELGTRAYLELLKGDSTVAEAGFFALSHSFTRQSVPPLSSRILQRVQEVLKDEPDVELGSAPFSVDINSACTGFLSAWVTAHSWLMGNPALKSALAIAVETPTLYTNFTDPETAIIFGDAAAGAQITRLHGLAGSRPAGLLDWIAFQDPEYAGILKTEDGYLKMRGREVFKVGVTHMEKSFEGLLKQSGTDRAEIDWIIPHQANQRMIEFFSKRMDLPMGRFLGNIQDFGNTASATIPSVYHQGRIRGKIQPGQTVMLMGCGAGFSSMAVLYREPQA